MTEFSQDSFNNFAGQCSMSDDVAAAQALYDVGDVDIKAVNWEGWSPLHYSVYGGCKEVSAWLINLGLDKDLKDNKGKSPVDLAKDAGRDLADWEAIFTGTWSGPNPSHSGPRIVSVEEAMALMAASMAHDGIFVMISEGNEQGIQEMITADKSVVHAKDPVSCFFLTFSIFYC